MGLLLPRTILQPDRSSALDHSRASEGLDAGDTTTLSTALRNEDIDSVWRRYLIEASDIFKTLVEVKVKGWESTEGDEYYKNTRQAADKSIQNADPETAAFFFDLMKKIGLDMNQATNVLRFQNIQAYTQPRILDLCLAPGGFSAAALEENPRATVRGISLPPSQGGVDIKIRNWSINPRIDFKLMDITMLAGEMDVGPADVPVDHPDRGNFFFDRPFVDEDKFDLVICGGGVLRTHRRPEYREAREATRLAASQLVLALQRVRPGGSLVVLLHKADSTRTGMLMHRLCRFSRLQPFKGDRGHTTRSSFYLVAKDVRSDSDAALRAVEDWKQDWRVATFGTDDEYAARVFISREDQVRLVEDFGQELVQLATPVWKVQLEALQRASFTRG